MALINLYLEMGTGMGLRRGRDWGRNITNVGFDDVDALPAACGRRALCYCLLTISGKAQKHLRNKYDSVITLRI